MHMLTPVFMQVLPPSDHQWCAHYHVIDVYIFLFMCIYKYVCIHTHLRHLYINLYIRYFVITLSWLCELCIYTPLPAEQVCLSFSPHYTSHKYQLTPLQRAGLGINPSSRGVSLHHSGAIISRCTLSVESCTPGQARLNAAVHTAPSTL